MSRLRYGRSYVREGRCRCLHKLLHAKSPLHSVHAELAATGGAQKLLAHHEAVWYIIEDAVDGNGKPVVGIDGEPSKVLTVISDREIRLVQTQPD